MASQNTMQQRRAEVAKLWLRSFTCDDIAKELHISERTAARDIQAIRDDLQTSRIDDMNTCADRSIMVLKTIQKEAWQLYRVAPINSLNRTGALNVVQSCEEKIAKIEGTLAPDATSARTLANIYETVSELLEEIDPALRIRFVKALRLKTNRLN